MISLDSQHRTLAEENPPGSRTRPMPAPSGLYRPAAVNNRLQALRDELKRLADLERLLARLAATCSEADGPSDAGMDGVARRARELAVRIERACRTVTELIARREPCDIIEDVAKGRRGQ